MPPRSAGSVHRAEGRSSGELRERPVRPLLSPTRARCDRRVSRNAQRRSVSNPIARSAFAIRVRYGGSLPQVSAAPDSPACRSLPGALEPECVGRDRLALRMSLPAAVRATAELDDPFLAPGTTASVCEFVRGCDGDGSRYRGGVDQVFAHDARSRPWSDRQVFAAHRARLRRRDPIALGVFFGRPPSRCRVWPPCIEPRSELLRLDVARSRFHRFRLEDGPVLPATSCKGYFLPPRSEPFPCPVALAEVDRYT